MKWLLLKKLNKENYTLKSAKIKLGDLIKLIEKNEYTTAARVFIGVF